MSACKYRWNNIKKLTLWQPFAIRNLFMENGGEIVSIVPPYFMESGIGQVVHMTAAQNR